MISVSSWRVRVGDFVLGPLSFEAPAGSYVTLIGPSGHGKSTLLWSLTGTLPAEGELRLGDRSLRRVPAHLRPLALVPQGGLLFPHLSVEGNVGYGLHGNSRERVRALANNWGCAHLLERRASTLSGGEAMRASLARAMGREPQLLLLDEPLAAIDEVGREPLREQLRALCGTQTVLHVTHDIDEAIELGTHLGVLQQGRLIAFGPTSQVLREPPSAEVASFLGLGNVLQGIFEPKSDDASLFRSSTDSSSAPGSDKSALEVLGVHRGPGYVSIPEEAVLVAKQTPEAVSARNTLPCTVAELREDRRGARIRLEGTFSLWARLERESVAALGLAPGTKAVAVIKASQVRALKG
jgi:molybdopterin-binding protein